MPILFLVFSTPGLVYGIASGSFKSTTDVIKAMECMPGLLSLLCSVPSRRSSQFPRDSQI